MNFSLSQEVLGGQVCYLPISKNALLRPHARCNPEGSAERREDCEYNLENLFPSFFLHNFLVFLVINKVSEM